MSDPSNKDAGPTTGACLGCRRIKVRCILPGLGACARCARLGLQCDVLPHRRGQRGLSTAMPERHGDRARPTSHIKNLSRFSSWAPVSSSPCIIINNVLSRSEEWNFTSDRSAFSRPLEDQLPDLDPVSLGIITISDAERLFKRYHNDLHCWAFMCDPIRQTAQVVRPRSTLLFTVICAVASIFCPLSKNTSQRLLEHADHVARVVMTQGYKSIEISQGFTLFSLYYPYPSSIATDRTWTYLGYGCRMLQELGYDQPCQFGSEEDDPEAEYQKRLATRAYIALYLCDVSLATHFGRARLFPVDNAISARAKRWAENSTLVEFDHRLPSVLRVRETMEKAGYEDPSRHKMLISEMESRRRQWTFQPDGWQNFFYDHVKLVLTMSPVGVLTMCQEEDDEITELAYNAALESVEHLVTELSDRGCLRFASNFGAFAFMYAATILFKMVSTSDPEFLAPQSQSALSLLKDLSEALRVAAAHRNDSQSWMKQYGELLQATIAGLQREAVPDGY